jgi:hypothetical protein
MVWVVSLFTMDVSTHCVSPEYYFWVFGVCMELVDRDGPLLQTVLYPPEYSLEALPK